MSPTQPLDQRLHLMVSRSMKDELALATGAPGMRSEADVVRYALEQILPSLIGAARERYAGRTRMLVDTADAPTKRVAGARPPSLRRPDFTPLPTEDLQPHLDALDQHVREIAEAATVPWVAIRDRHGAEAVEIAWGTPAPRTTHPAASPDDVAPTA